MNIEKLKKEINEGAYFDFGDPNNISTVIDIDSLMDIIDKMVVNDNDALDIVNLRLAKDAREEAAEAIKRLSKTYY